MEGLIEKYSEVHESPHYRFHYAKNSVAEREIEEIAEEQERCFAKITERLGVLPEFKIRYFLTESPEDVGAFYGDNESCNGFARMPDQIYAVYNEEVRCIGMHEDTHLISYVRGKPDCAFLREGLAMMMDEVWWGEPNETWVERFYEEGKMPSVRTLFDSESFYELSCEISYPVAGAFTRFLCDRVGEARFLEEVYYGGGDPVEKIEKLLRKSFSETEEEFRRTIVKGKRKERSP